ncbi:MAG: hypothetical protein JST55_12725 [Bacteroidetes bacterium]|nr:hypothetical protein [Bacteroidota bacterium]
MKNKLLLILFFLGFIISGIGAKPNVRIITGNPYDFRPSSTDAVIKLQVALNPNNVGTWVWNTGVLNQDLRTTNTPGFEWPKGTGKFAIFTTGLSIGTYINGNLRMGNASYNGEYAPGYVDQTVPTDPKYKTNSNFKIYKVTSGDNANTNPDYANWGVMVPYGAPYVDIDGNGQYNPSIDRPGIKDASQTVFVCLTDADPSNHTTSEGFSGGTLPIFAETHLTVWAYTTPGLEDLQFVNWVVINRSGKNWDSTHFGVVVDPDLGYPKDDYIGCDTSKNMGYVYNATNTDGTGAPGQYGTAPPASGMDFFHSPIRPTGNLADADTTYFPPGSENKVIKRGYKQLGLTSFVYFSNTDAGGPLCEQDPSSAPSQAYNYLTGVKKDGTPWINAQTSQLTKFCYPGDPETGGWTEFFGYVKNCGGVTSGQVEASPPGDRRFIFNSGAKSFTVAPGDTQNITVAQFVAKGSNNKNSVTKLKGNDIIAQKVFDLNFKVIPPPPPPVVNVAYRPNSTIGTVDVSFSWGDVSEQYNYKDQLFNQGTYRFQGYEIYEIKKSATQLPDFSRPETINNDVVLIDAFDLRDTIGIVLDNFRTGVTIHDTEQVAPFPIVPPYKMPLPAGFPNKGIQRNITLNKTQYASEYNGNDKFIVGNEYKFAIVAYGVCDPRIDSTGHSAVLNGGKVIRNSLSTQLITIRPEAPTAGTNYYLSNGDTITTNRRDLGVIPIVVDQTQLLNAKYRISFKADTTYNILRQLSGSTAFDTLKKVRDKDSKFITGYDSTATVLNLKFTRNRSGGTDSARVVDGILMNVVRIRSNDPQSGNPNNLGVLKDVTSTMKPDSIQTRLRGWEYFPSNNNWLTGSNFKIADDKGWQSTSMSLTYPTVFTYTGLGSAYKADSLKRVRIAFVADTNSGQSAYRFVSNRQTAGYLADPSYAPYISNGAVGFIYQDRRKVPFKVFEVDPLTGADVRQLNCAFLENNDTMPRGRVDGKWNPTSDEYGSGERLYIFGSTYQEADIAPYNTYTTAGNNLFVRQQTSADIMYVWSPRAINASAKWNAGDSFVIYPYTVTRPGVVYEFDSQQPQIGNTSVASERGALNDIRVVPNPYYGFNVNEKSSTNRFVTFRKLPINCTIRIYTLNGDLVKKLVKNDQNSTMNWDLTNLDAIPIASGLYLALIDAPGIGQKTMKLAIFTPEERVDF